MKKLLTAAVIIISMSFVCNKEDCRNDKDVDGKKFSGKGVITSMSGEKCACCWGWNISIDGKSYRFEKVPAGSINLETLTYPTPVSITWRDVKGGCNGTIIEVLAISK